MTLPLVILGSLGIKLSSFSSRIQLATTFDDSLPCSGVSKRPSRLALAGLNQVVAGEAGQLAELRDEFR